MSDTHQSYSYITEWALLFLLSVSWCWVIFHLGSSITPSTHFAVLLFNQLFLILYLFIWFLLPLLSASRLPLLSLFAWFKAVSSIHRNCSEFWKSLLKHLQPSPASAISALSFLRAESLVRTLNRPGFRTNPQGTSLDTSRYAQYLWEEKLVFEHKLWS